MNEQLETMGKDLAQLVHSSYAWEEPMNLDDINSISKAFRKELKQLNGED